MKLEDIDISSYETIMLDRDGTINRQRQGDYVKCWDEFEFLPNVKESIARFAKSAVHIFIVSNQRGIGKGCFSIEQLNDIHSQMICEIESAGGRIDKIYFSTALTDEDFTRKPNIGMWTQICSDFPDVKAKRAIMIGDSECDMKFAENCGVKGIQIDKQDVIFIKETTD